MPDQLIFGIIPFPTLESPLTAARVQILKEQGKESILTKTYNNCKSQENLPKEEMVNYVKDIYKLFTAEEISKKMSFRLFFSQLFP